MAAFIKKRNNIGAGPLIRRTDSINQLNLNTPASSKQQIETPVFSDFPQYLTQIWIVSV
jgi:hypothetical protein